MGDKPLESYGLLSDRHTAALVAADGSVDWLCLPRFDSPAVFAALLGGDTDAGRWSIHPTALAEVSRAYLDGTMVLHTRHTGAEGELEVTDALAVGSAADPHRLGADAPHALIRQVACTAGSLEVAVDFRPRPEFGLVVPVVSGCEGGVVAHGGPLVLVLASPVPLAAGEGGATGTIRLRAAQVLRFALRWAPLSDPAPGPWHQAEIGDQLAATIAAWRAWSAAHQSYQGPWQELVHHSGRVLQGLSYQPTGAIVAAPTTSLPETVGGGRNWDYRYTWIRDAALTMDALWVAACPDEAHEFFAFMTAAAATVRPRAHLQIVYGIGGEHDLTEHTLPHLSGWRDSRPVRVGNAAWAQAQLDVYGELLATAARFHDQLPDGGAPLRVFLTSLADTAAQVWQQPDHGIWEIRGRPRHFLHSKLMCWVALDRAVGLADRLEAADRAPAWKSARDQIRHAIQEQGWNEATGAYTQSFGATALDAAALMIPIVGFAPGDDPRVLSTIEAVAEQLTDQRGLVHRYDTDDGVDGLVGEEGAFLLCTFWLARARALAGQLKLARQVFERAAACANDLGLLSEQADPDTGTLLGNFPQAFSHIGLVNAAYTIALAEQGAEPHV